MSNEEYMIRLARVANLEILTAKDVAVMLDYSVKSVQNMAAEGRIPCHKNLSTGRNYFNKSEIKTWMTTWNRQ